MMGRKKKTAEAEGTEAPAKGGKSMMLPAIVVAVAVLGAGWFMKGGSGGAPAAEATPTPEPEPTEHVEGPVIETDPMTLNLADGHYLKVGLALQLAAPDEEAAAGGHGGGGEETGPSPAKALDLAISTFSTHTKAELSDARKREHVKEELAKEVTHAYHGEVVGLYFTEFVMQ
jgi:flagellar FliL protein